MLNTFEVNKVLIIAPLRVACDTWPAEIEKWDHLKGLDISVIVGDVKTRIAAVHHPAMIYIVNRENVKWLVEYYEKNGMRWDFGMVVIDELSSFKNYQSQRFKYLRKVRPFVKRWVGLTGTPSSNGLMDLWAEIGILDGGERLGKFIGRYREAYFKAGSMNPATGVVFQYKPREGAEELIYQHISDITISMKALDYLHVLDAGREARLVYGLKQNCTKAEMRRAIANGTVMKYLQKVPIHKDDLFFIQAGTVHAIGAGALVAEIQENSNLTYRLYDYDRVGKDGKKRELHIDKALDVANLKSSAEPKQPLRVLKYRQGIASELLTRCKYFEVYRMIVNTERRQKVHYRADEIAFRVLLCVNGCGTISYEGGNLPFYKGDCIFVPADSEVLTIHGQAQFLDVRG